MAAGVILENLNYFNLLVENEAEERAKEEKKRKHKEEMAKKKEEKRKVQEAKRQKTTKTKQPPLPGEEDGEHCTICSRVVPCGSGDDAIDEWVQCDLCVLWFHVECSEVEEVPDTEFLCHKCCLSA